MKDFDKLIEIAADLQLDNVAGELLYLKSRYEMDNKDLIIPLVGEFSSGKTTLINSLLGSKNLETASKATTATIFEVRFGRNNSMAEIIDENGEITKTIEDIASIKNEDLPDKSIVRIYDTSSLVSQSTVLVDTPGLSSNDPRHRIALASYLPNADAIFLVSDVNQQITRSLTDFINSSRISEKPLYLILTKCDTKTRDEVESAKRYISENINLPVENIICISAAGNDMTEFFSLMDKIQLEKNVIVTKAIEQRLAESVSYLKKHVDMLLMNAEQPKDLDGQIKIEQNKLNILKKNNQNLLKETEKKVSELEDSFCKEFSDNAFSRLDSIVTSKSDDYDNAVFSAVNSLATLVLSRYQGKIRDTLSEIATKKQNSDNAVPMQSIGMLDLSSILPASFEFSYDMNLTSMGHEHDKAITRITKVAGAVAAVAVTAGVATAAGGAAATAASGARVATAASSIDTVTDIGSMIYSQKVINSINSKRHHIATMYRQIETGDRDIQEKMNLNKGIIETGVSWITDQLSGKPQRRRAIMTYISDNLIPEFSSLLSSVKNSFLKAVGDMLNAEAGEIIAQREDALKKLKNEYEMQIETFERRIDQYKKYKAYLN